MTSSSINSAPLIVRPNKPIEISKGKQKHGQLAKDGRSDKLIEKT